MPRAKRGFKARRRRNRILNAAEGYYGSRSRLFAFANEVGTGLERDVVLLVTKQQQGVHQVPPRSTFSLERVKGM